MWYFTDGRSGTAPPSTRTTEFSWRLWPIPGMYAVTSIPFVRRTRAILRRAEFGFLGVIVRTTVQTPRFWGAPRRSLVWRPLSEFQVVRRAGVSTFFFWSLRPLRTSCEIVGTVTPTPITYPGFAQTRANARLSGLGSCVGPPRPKSRPLRERSSGAARPRSQHRDRADARNDRPC